MECVAMQFVGSYKHQHNTALMMEEGRNSETSVDNYFTRQYIPEDKSEHNFGGTYDPYP
jgi:hypothetical protein